MHAFDEESGRYVPFTKTMLTLFDLITIKKMRGSFYLNYIHKTLITSPFDSIANDINSKFTLIEFCFVTDKDGKEWIKFNGT